ncbi:BC1872 family protein [Sporolactobacillus sp. KGMB 08714]|uniref:BC1872 family protein n=1 Tax=Sporolactobacillus sp. KGMB 08714 TaxID=3064704 RepID=UPI002FBD710F
MSMMTNLEIDRKLAEAMGYKILNENFRGHLMLIDPKSHDAWGEFSYGCEWKPTESMSDAWKVAERFGLAELKNQRYGNGRWKALMAIKHSYWFMQAEAETAPLAICKAALKVIEGSKNNAAENHL